MRDKPESAPDRCPHCGSDQLHMGYGLAGGGLGPYVYCAHCARVVWKAPEPKDD